MGDLALLVECGGGDGALALAEHLRLHPVSGVVEAVPGATAVLVRLAHGRARSGAARLLAGLEVPGEREGGVGFASGGTVVVDTVYDGEDLEMVAEHRGVSVEALVDWHTGTAWRVGFVGFAPGFAYLLPEHPAPDVPRRTTPRVRVPAGSVAVAGPFSAVYPRESPGGWQLLGRTDRAVWDLAEDPPARLLPGTSVRFRARRPGVRTGARPPREAGPRPARGPVTAGSGALVVVSTGPLALVEDLGRPGRAGWGVPTSGALDRGATVRANRLVGNRRGAAVLEVLLGGLAVRAAGDHVLAVTGARCPLRVLDADGALLARPDLDRPFSVPDGTTLHLDPPSSGLRAYLAVRGGLGVPPVLGSRAVDVLSGLGGGPLRPGDALPVLTEVEGSVADLADPVDPPGGPEHAVRVVLGPRDDWMTDAGRRRLLGTGWTVSDRSSRVGLRLAGEPVERAVTGELPSEGTVPGAVQLPPSGEPILFLADHPVTGGYPVVAVVVSEDLDGLAHARPGDRIRLRAVEPPG